MGLSIAAAVLQCVGEKRLGDTRGECGDDGVHPQFLERAGVGGSAEMGEEMSWVSSQSLLNVEQ